MRAKSLVVVALFVAFGAAACGSSGSSKGAAGGTTAAKSSPGSPGAAPATNPSPGGSGGGGGGNFCDLAKSDQSAFSGSNTAAITPAQLKKEFENIGPALQHAEQVAPSQIKPDFQVFLNAFQPYLAALAAANYDFTKLNFQDPKLQALASPQVKAASDHIESYFETTCHITPPST